MRRLMLAALAAGAVFGAASLDVRGAQALTLPGAGSVGAAVPAALDDVALVCRRVWNGFRWVRSCYQTGPRYYGYYGAPPPPPPRYYRRRYYY